MSRVVLWLTLATAALAINQHRLSRANDNGADVAAPAAAAPAAAAPAAAAPVAPAPEKKDDEHERTVRPHLVSSLDGAASHLAAAADGMEPLQLPADLQGKHVTVAAADETFSRIQAQAHAYDETLATLGRQLEATLKQSTKLKLTKSLMSGIYSLKKAERVLKAIDAAVANSKNRIRAAGERADDIAHSIKSAEVEHRREIARLNGSLDQLKQSLRKHEGRLTALAGRRTRVQQVVRKWKDHVYTLRAAHEAFSAGLAGGAAGGAHGAGRRAAGALSSLALVDPPKTSDVLAQIGVPEPAKGSLRGLRALLAGDAMDEGAAHRGGAANLEVVADKVAHDAGLRMADAASSMSAAGESAGAAGAEGSSASEAQGALDNASAVAAEAGADADADADSAADAQLDEEAAALENELNQAGAAAAASEPDAHKPKAADDAPAASE